jgi:hypothetical protein
MYLSALFLVQGGKWACKSTCLPALWSWVPMSRRNLLVPSSGQKVWSSKFRRKVVKYLRNYSTSRPKQKRNLGKLCVVSESDTYYMYVKKFRENNSTLEANRHKMSEEMYIIWQKPTVRHSVYSYKLLFLILSKMKTTHVLKLHSHHSHFNTIFSSIRRFSKYSLSFSLASLDTKCTALLNRLSHMSRLCRRPLFEHPNNIWPREPITNAEICTLFLLPLNVPPSHVQILSPALPYWTL